MSQKITVSLSASDLANVSQTNPFAVLPAAGAGKFYRLISSVWQYVFGTTPYTVANPSVFVFQFGTSGQADNMLLNCVGFLDQSQTMLTYLASTGPFDFNPQTIYEHAPVTLALGGSLSGGDGSLNVTLEYEEVALPLA